MNQTLNNALELVKMANVQVFPRSVKKQITLFEQEMSAEINFNGYNNLNSYQHHLEAFYMACKQEIALEINLGQNQIEDLKRQFDLSKFEVREFRQRNFPKNDNDTLFHRIQFIKSARIDHISDDGIKKNSKLFSDSVPAS
jgi:hypothetical protein